MGQPSISKPFGSQAFGSASIAAENARFMSRVYGWMTGGLCLTGAVAWNVSGNPELVQTIFGNRLLFWGLIIAQLGAVAALSGLINRISGLTATFIYFLYAGLTGLTLSSIFLVYTSSSIAEVFGVTAFGFAGLSGFGFVTKRDLGPVGSFCMMGLFGLVGFGLLSMFFPSLMTGGSSFVFSIVGIVVICGTHRLRYTEDQGDEHSRQRGNRRWTQDSDLRRPEAVSRLHQPVP
jgi:FtsH-binding integral membrane protein